MAKGQKLDLSPEERARRSEQMKGINAKRAAAGTAAPELEEPPRRDEPDEDGEDFELFDLD